jgi:GNAT superfamily N-acetyltransferase
MPVEPKEANQLRLEPLTKAHKRNDFHCGIEPLDRYFREQIGQEQRKRVAAPFVLFEADNLVGYYTLSMTSIVTTDLPAEYSKKLPRYDVLPAVLLGRLAVDARYQGRGFGESLLIDALYRALDNPIAAAFVIVDAIDERAKRFYANYGFIPLLDDEKRLFIPMKTIEQLPQS